MILTFELTKDHNQIEIVFNKEGLTYLKNILEKIHPDRTHLDHVHLMTKEWGGHELTSEAIHPGNTLINHVKLIQVER
jgi:hypothetical protein